LLTESGVESGKMHNMKVIDNLETFPESINTLLYNQRLLAVLLELSSEQIKLSGQVWSLRPLPKEIGKNSEYNDYR
jgi:hypothetical protein